MVADAGEAARSGGRPVWPGRAVVVVAGVRAALLARGAEPGLVRFDVADSGAPIRWTRRRTEECGAPWPVGTGRRAPTATIQGVATEAGSDEDLIPQASTAITVSSALAGTS
jgi:hypothetical protein